MVYNPPRDPPSLGTKKLFWVSFSLVAALMSLWALATPLMGVPDEPSHVIRAASVVRGQLSPGQSRKDPSQLAAEVPRYVAETPDEVCFAFHRNKPANCPTNSHANDDSLVAASTSAGANGLAFYAVVGLPTLFLSGDIALYAMRIVSAILCAMLLAFAFVSVRALVPPGRAPTWSFVALAVSITPMALFLGGSVNPNGVEFASAVAVLATLLTIFRIPSTRTQLWRRATVAVISVVFLLGTRSVALLWLVIIVAVSVLLARFDVLLPLFKRAATWFALVLIGGASFFALYWFTRALPTTGVPHQVASFGDGFVFVVTRTIYYSGGIVGLFGWVDRPAPFLVYLICAVAIVSVVIVALLRSRRRFLLAVAGMIAIVLFTPGIIQGLLAPAAGIIWQGRYMLALYGCLLLICGVAVDVQPPFRIERWLSLARSLAIVLLSVAQLYALVAILQTYVVGGDKPWGKMFADPSWQPPLTWIGLSALFAGVLVLSCVALIRTTKWRPPSPSEVSTAVAAGPVYREKPTT